MTPTLSAEVAELLALDSDSWSWSHFPRMAALIRNLLAALREAEKDRPQVAWLCERGDNEPTQYVHIDPSGFFAWTPDVNKALRLCRREDADAVAAVVEDCWRVAEHRWG